MKWCQLSKLWWKKRKEAKSIPKSKKRKNIIANNSGSVYGSSQSTSTIYFIGQDAVLNDAVCISGQLNMQQENKCIQKQEWRYIPCYQSRKYSTKGFFFPLHLQLYAYIEAVSQTPQWSLDWLLSICLPTYLSNLS